MNNLAFLKRGATIRLFPYTYLDLQKYNELLKYIIVSNIKILCSMNILNKS